MSDDELDHAYTTLCESMARVGEERSTLLLAMLALSLMSRHGDAAEALRLIAQAEAGCGE